MPAPDRENLARLATVLEALDYRISGTEEFESEEVVHPDAEALEAGGSWVLITKYGGLDIMQRVLPDLEYADLEPEAISAEVFGIDEPAAQAPVFAAGPPDVANRRAIPPRPTSIALQKGPLWNGRPFRNRQGTDRPSIFFPMRQVLELPTW